MTEKKIDGDFTACDAALLNSFFRDYNAAHTRGGEHQAAQKDLPWIPALSGLQTAWRHDQ